MQPKDQSDLSGTYVFDEDAVEEMEDFEATAVLDEDAAKQRFTDTVTLNEQFSRDGFLDDIDEPSITGIFEKD